MIQKYNVLQQYGPKVKLQQYDPKNAPEEENPYQPIFMLCFEKNVKNSTNIIRTELSGELELQHH